MASSPEEKELTCVTCEFLDMGPLTQSSSLEMMLTATVDGQNPRNHCLLVFTGQSFSRGFLRWCRGSRNHLQPCSTEARCFGDVWSFDAQATRWTLRRGARLNLRPWGSMGGLPKPPSSRFQPRLYIWFWGGQRTTRLPHHS